MSSRVRLLPTLIGAAGVLLFLRLGAMAADPAADAEAGGDAATKEVTAPQVGAAAEDVAKPVAASPPAQPAPAMVVPSTKGEADVLQRLVERRAALDEREKNVGLREKMLSAAEKQVDAKLSELKQLEQKLEALVSKRNEMEETQLSSLVKTYEAGRCSEDFQPARARNPGRCRASHEACQNRCCACGHGACTGAGLDRIAGSQTEGHARWTRERRW